MIARLFEDSVVGHKHVKHCINTNLERSYGPCRNETIFVEVHTDVTRYRVIMAVIMQRPLAGQVKAHMNSNHTVPQFHKYVSKIMVQVPTRTPRIMESRRRRDLIIETRLLIPGILSERRSELDIENLTGNTYS